LAQVVDYQISFWLVKSWSDKLELEAKIYDEKWDRDVKSLSGWQRIILKLVRMLAISSYIQSPMLFLDETINNLDMDTVWKVAEMLEDFVKQRDIKLYTVTHSQQIQEMDIRDSVIQI
jgi:DNA repair exonuclease SbcCD ATPase subunit